MERRLFPEGRWQSEGTLRVARWLLAVASALSAYLVHAGMTDEYPVGCGPAGGCSDILQSPWSRLLGLPVSYFGLAVYVALWVSLPRRAVHQGPSGFRAACSVGLAMVIICAAVWFSAIQLFVLGRICWLCTAAHTAALGASIAVMLAYKVVRSGSKLRRHAVTACGVFGVGAALQTAFLADSSPPRAFEFPSQQGADALSATPSNDPRGNLVLPHIGAAFPATTVTCVFDYTCDQCRKTFKLLDLLAAEPRNRIRIVLAPAPLSAKCNRHVSARHPADEGACVYARLALAVWVGAPERFMEFNAWLFSSPTPRTADAEHRAASYLNSAELQELLVPGGPVDRLLAECIEYFRTYSERTGYWTLPQIAVDRRIIVGDATSGTYLRSLLSTP